MSSAMAALCEGWIAPLAVSLLVEACDPESYYAVADGGAPSRPSWFLRREQLDEALLVSPTFSEATERRVAALGGRELRVLVEEVLAQPAPASHLVVSLATLVSNAVALELPAEGALALRSAGGPLRPLVLEEGAQRLVLGPDHGPVGAPAVVRAFNEPGLTRLELSLDWDLWLEHPAGRARTRAALARVLARPGWQLDQGALP